jgi:8-oxo-dGTP diphosphatase
MSQSISVSDKRASQFKWQALSHSILGLICPFPLPGTGIIALLPERQLVLIRRRDTRRWALPGGMIEWGESIVQTVRQELLEETGLELIKVRGLAGVYSSPERDPRFHSICVVVVADVRGEIKIKDTLEIIEAKTFSLDDLPQANQLSFDNAQQLQNYFKGSIALE